MCKGRFTLLRRIYAILYPTLLSDPHLHKNATADVGYSTGYAVTKDVDSMQKYNGAFPLEIPESISTARKHW